MYGKGFSYLPSLLYHPYFVCILYGALLISKLHHLIKLLQKLGHVVILDFVMATTLLMRVKQLSTPHRSMLFQSSFLSNVQASHSQN